MLKSQKGKDIKFYNGYRYRRDRISASSESWRCALKTCKGRFVCRGLENNERTPHNHAPVPAEEEVNFAKNKIKELAQSTALKPRTIIQTASAMVKSTEASTSLPSYDANRKIVKRQRESSKNLGINFSENLSEIKTSKGKSFLLWDSKEENESESRILLFGTEENLNLLLEFDHWSVDGTFSVVPQMSFSQLFTIHVIIEKREIPVVFALLENKQAQTYRRLFLKLKQIKPSLTPTSVLVDFEVACFSIIKEAFQTTDITACFFHLTQCLWRKIQHLGLVENYKSSEDFRNNCKMLAALAYVPVADVQFALEIVAENFPVEMRPLVDYWERNYVGKRLQNILPKFPIEMWNIFQRIKDNLPTTNNSLEAWHLSFQKSIDCHNPSLHKLCQHFINEQDLSEMFILRYRAGFRQSNATHSKYYQRNKRIKTLINDYSFRNVEQHLRSITFNLSL